MENTSTPHQLLLDIAFEPRDVAQVEIGEFHFVPGQIAPVHTHEAPSIGYVSKGTLILHVEGMTPQVLKTGDAFHEPAGPRILSFDNASQTEEAIFIDFNLERVGEPFIVFPKPLTEPVDRRTFPTVPVNQKLRSALAYADTIAAGQSVTLERGIAVAFVAQGNISFQTGKSAPQRVEQGKTFHSLNGEATRITAEGAAAKVVSFYLRKEAKNG